VTGAVVTASTAFALVWLIHWSRSGRMAGFSKSRLAVVLIAFVLGGTVLYAYAKRQWLQYLRQHAVNVGQTLVTNMQAFNSSSAAALALIQEVELVSRGYRLSSPLPPITRLEEKGQARRCARLRKSLHRAYAACVPPFQESCSSLRSLISEDDFEKYLDVYDITNPDIQEANLGFSSTEFDDMESLKSLRIFQLRLSVLRRVFLCSLLSLEADGRKTDFPRWKTAVDAMERLASVTAEYSEKINSILLEEESFSFPSTPSKRHSINPERDRLRNQVRKLGSLSSGIRGLQAKLQILREESSKSLEETDDVSEIGASLLAQYDSIGADLKSLMQAWETGKASLVAGLERTERRISQASSSGLRSPAMSLGGLTAVDEMISGGSPTDALRALNGEIPLHASDSSGPHSADSQSDEEIFEAIAIPRTRPSLTREQRIAKMQEERVRATAARERRDAGMSMIRELESVIHLRPAPGGKNKPGRITSI
jgi:Mysoin-binding motif of peroxisomes